MSIASPPVDAPAVSAMPRSPATDASVDAAVTRQRIHYLDNLRAIAMLLGIFLHAGLAYAEPARSVWIATDPVGSVGIDAGIWFVHLFRMGLFFLLSGYLANSVISAKGRRYFVRSRLIRILLPFVCFYPFLLAATTVVIVFAVSYLKQPLGLMGLIAAASTAPPRGGSPDPVPLSTMHLWFLNYLLAFSAIAVVTSRANWRLPDRWRVGPRWWLFSPILLVPGVWAAGIPIPPPESFVPQIWPFAVYGLFYLAGYGMHGREAVLEDYRRWVWPLTIVSAGLFVPYYVLMPTLDLNALITRSVPIGGWRTGLLAVLTAYLSASLCVVALLLGKRYLADRSPLLSFVADASYWMYLIHLPIVLFLQTVLIPVPWPIAVKLVVVIGATILSCLATYVVFVRYTPLGWMLHGRRGFP